MTKGQSENIQPTFSNESNMSYESSSDQNPNLRNEAMDDHQIESQISQGYRETKDRLAAPKKKLSLSGKYRNGSIIDAPSALPE